MKKTILTLSFVIVGIIANAQTRKNNNFEKYLGAAVLAHVGTAYFDAMHNKTDNTMYKYYRNSTLFLSSALLVSALKELKVKNIEPSKQGFGISYKF